MKLYFSGVHSVQVALLSEIATVEFDEDLTDSDILAKDIASLGFDVELIALTTDTELTTVRFKVSAVCNLSIIGTRILCRLCERTR